MDFFEHQEQARRKTKRLVFYFALAVILIVVSVYLAVLAGLAFVPSVESITKALDEDGRFTWHVLWQPKLFLWVASVTIVVILLTSLAKIHELAQGGRGRRLCGAREQSAG